MNWGIFTKDESGLKINNIIKKIFPLLTIAAFLPVFFVLLMNPPNLNFSPQANQEPELGVWLEPASVISKAGMEVELTVHASINDNSVTIPALTIMLLPDQSLVLDKTDLSTAVSFNGKTTLGKVKIVATQNGEFKLHIPEEGVKVEGLTKPIKIKTASTNVIVR